MTSLTVGNYYLTIKEEIMKDSQYISIQGWMGKRLGLRGNDLICFAVIYGFSMDGESQFKGNLDYLCACMFVTRPTALLALNKLLECNLILKQEKVVNGKKRCFYATNVIYDDGAFSVVDTNKGPLLMTSKEPLPQTSKDPLPKKYNNKEDKKRLSNDNPKDDYHDDFLEFYNAYGYAKSKSKAYQSWKKLSKKDKKAAIDAIPAYKEDCKANDREMKYPSTYLNQRTWEDDFDISKKSVLCYEPLPDDEDKVLRFKRWMRENHAEIEFTEKPLTFDGYMRLQNEYGMDEVCNQLDYIDANIGRFRKSDIEASIKYYFEHQQYD